MIVKATYHSIWDGGTEVPSPCSYDTDERRCFDIEMSDYPVETIDILDSEFVELEDGSRLSADEGVVFDY